MNLLQLNLKLKITRGEKEERDFFYIIFCTHNPKEGLAWDLFYIRLVGAELPISRYEKEKNRSILDVLTIESILYNKNLSETESLLM